MYAEGEDSNEKWFLHCENNKVCCKKAKVVIVEEELLP
jgi:hypothetical protein